ncbi:MAG: flagellar export chaperone FliS [Deltaproteobacteria bacterium]|nr:flagellar export chaperone FliS [Deltaproteobacteria bacterium]
MYQPWQTYKDTMAERILSARPEQLLAMLYEGMITKIKQAGERFQAKQDIPARESLIRAMRIADTLMDHLDLEHGGEAAKNLEQLYAFVVSSLSKASLEDDPEPHLNHALRTLEPLYRAWQQLAERAMSEGGR